jgi:hypothetical protein
LEIRRLPSVARPTKGSRPRHHRREMNIFLTIFVSQRIGPTRCICNSNNSVVCLSVSTVFNSNEIELRFCIDYFYFTVCFLKDDLNITA